MTFRIGIDVGGTFTDFLLVDGDGKSSVFKTRSTPKDPSIGVLDGLREMASGAGLGLNEFAGRVELIVHGTTVTTNAVLTGNGVKTGLLTTEGFRDILEMRRGYREKLYDNKLTPPRPLVPRDLRLAIVERTDIDGKVVTPLDDSSVLSAIETLKDEGVAAVTVCFMHSYANGDHERQTGEILRREMPETFVTLSADLLPKARMYERISTAVLNSYIGPVLSDYLKSLAAALADIGFSGVLLIMQSNGGVATPEASAKTPVMTLLSGPAGGPVAGITCAGVQGFDQCITVDMGGTSFDASLVQNSTPLLRGDGWINRQQLALPMLDIHTIGAGGGSIGWIDDGGLLRMGPHSAGAEPGAACYGHGGDRPTCTDANLVLGYLNPDYFLGGRMALDVEAARNAIDNHVAKPLGLSIEQAAAGMFHVMNVNMAAGLKEISVSRGIDPREYPLVVAGGAGPIHGAMIATELEIPVILMPRDSSIFCASGMLRSDLKHSYVRTYHALISKADRALMARYFAAMTEDGRRVLQEEGLDDDRLIRMEYAVDMRYLGQHNEITVDFDLAGFEAQGPDYLCERFHDEHERLYGYMLRDSGTEMEVVNLRLTAIGVTDKPGLRKMARGSADCAASLKGRRPVYLPDAGDFSPVPVYDGDAMTFANRGVGPAIIEQITTTTFVPPGYNFVVDAAGSFCLYPEGGGDSYLERVLT